MAEVGGVDIATLGLRVDAREAREGTNALRDLEQQGARTERRFITLAEFDARRARTTAINTRALRERAQTEREVAGLMNQTANATQNVAQKSRLAGAPIARLNNSMVVLARQAAGAHPVMGQLADAVGTFAIGTARMVPILAGIAAVAAGINFITREAREAKKALEEQLDVLREIARERDIEARGGATRIALEAGRAEAASIAAALRGSVGGTDVSLGNLYAPTAGANADQLLERLRAQNRLNAAAAAALEEQEQAERARARRERLRTRNRSDAAALGFLNRSVRDLNINIGRDIAETDVLVTRQVNQDRLQLERQFQRERLDIAREFAAETERVTGGVGSGLAGAQGQKEYEEALAREQELSDARLRANDALIRSLENVGRAYGGVVDQVLALTAAVLSLERMPLVSNGDKARAYGSAALSGIGIGATTGNPLLGAAGGAASGFALAGPAGAIVGGVGGIVSGLIESGRRAREAQRIWRNALEDFDRMFDDLTPLESNIAALDRAFRQLSGGRTVDEVRAYVEALRGYLGQGTLFPNQNFLREQIAQYEELLRIYEENAAQAKDLAEAERDLYDARFRALNAPSGFNLAYFGFQAGAGFTPPGGSGGGGGSSGGGFVDVPGEPGGITVNVYVDGEQVASTVETRQAGSLLRGGPSPYTPTAR